MAVIGKLYRVNKHYAGHAHALNPPAGIALVIKRYSNVAGRYGVRVEYVIGEYITHLEETTFHQYFDLLEEEP